MSVSAISTHAGASAQHGMAQIERAGGSGSPRSGSAEAVTIEFAPPARANSPIQQLGGGIMDSLRNLEQTRAAKRDAMGQMGNGPASPLDAAKREFLSGPASIRPASGQAMVETGQKSAGVEDAVGAMTRSFDYAIETQLIVKTGSQLSSSASSLMRGQ